MDNHNHEHNHSHTHSEEKHCHVHNHDKEKCHEHEHEHSADTHTHGHHHHDDSHHEHNHHDHSHHEHSHEPAKDELRMLTILLDHWVNHNDDHGKEFYEWSEKATKMDKPETAKAIMEAVSYIKKATESLIMAKDKLK